MKLYRRTLGLAAGSAAVSGLTLFIVSCAVPAGTATPPPTPTGPPQNSVQEYSGLIAAGAKAVTDSLLQTPGLAPATAAQITKDEAQVQAANSAIQSVTNTTTNATLLGNAVQDLGPILLGMIPGGTEAWMAVNAFMALTNSMLTLAGVAPPPTAAKAKTPVMSEVESVLILRGFTRR